LPFPRMPPPACQCRVRRFCCFACRLPAVALVCLLRFAFLRITRVPLPLLTRCRYGFVAVGFSACVACHGWVLRTSDYGFCLLLFCLPGFPAWCQHMVQTSGFLPFSFLGARCCCRLGAMVMPLRAGTPCLPLRLPLAWCLQQIARGLPACLGACCRLPALPATGCLHWMLNLPLPARRAALLLQDAPLCLARIAGLDCLSAPCCWFAQTTRLRLRLGFSAWFRLGWVPRGLVSSAFPDRLVGRLMLNPQRALPLVAAVAAVGHLTPSAAPSATRFSTRARDPGFGRPANWCRLMVSSTPSSTNCLLLGCLPARPLPAAANRCCRSRVPAVQIAGHHWCLPAAVRADYWVPRLPLVQIFCGWIECLPRCRCVHLPLFLPACRFCLRFSAGSLNRLHSLGRLVSQRAWIAVARLRADLRTLRASPRFNISGFCRLIRARLAFLVCAFWLNAFRSNALSCGTLLPRFCLPRGSPVGCGTPV